MNRALSICTLLLTALPALPKTIWIEAEAPSRTNFPAAAENPFAPRAFWEEDLLSGRAWIGAHWDIDKVAQLFLEYEFETPREGDFALYARKFFTYGNFRWQVDGGPWMDVPDSLHQAVDPVSFRDTANEIVTLSWHYMGSVKLTAGPHRLRIEPRHAEIPRRPGSPPLPGYPLAYDAFVFTDEPFFPAGKLKPGERFEARSGSAFAFQPERDPFSASSIDWRSLNETFAGEQGGIEIKDGQFVFRTSGTPVRLLGVNLFYGPKADPDTVTYLARALAKKGVNLIRFDLGQLFEGRRDGDGNLTLITDRDMLASLLELIAAFKAQGIYTALTWNLSNSKNLPEIDGFDANATNVLQSTDHTSHHVVFDPRYQKLVKEGWREVLASEMPGGGPLGSDPALALITLGQQLTIFSKWPSDQHPLPAEIREKMEAAFVKWLESRFKSVEAAKKSWQQKGVQLPDGSSLLPHLAEITKRPDARGRDATRFLAEAQRAWFDDLTAFVRSESGYRGLISHSNRPVSRPDLFGLPAAWTGFRADISERIGVFVAPYHPPDNIWVIAAGSRFSDRSALRFDPLEGFANHRFELPLKALSFDGKPSALTEVGWSAPNRYRGEMPLIAFPVACLQDVRLICFQGLFGFSWHQSLPTARLPLFTPAGLGQFPAFAFAYRRGLLPGPTRAAKWQLTEEEVFSLRPPPINDAVASLIGLPLEELTVPEESLHSALYLTGQIAVQSGAKAPKLVVDNDALDAIEKDGIEAASGAIRWDSSRGLLTINAPQFQAIGGFLKVAGPQAADQLSLTSTNDFGVVCLVSLDGKSLDFSSKMLLQVFTEERNTGEFIEGTTNRVLRSIGRPPLVVEAVRGLVSLNRPDASEILVTALDANGYPVLPVGNASELRLLPATYYYLLEK